MDPLPAKSITDYFLMLNQFYDLLLHNTKCISSRVQQPNKHDGVKIYLLAIHIKAAAMHHRQWLLLKGRNQFL